MSDNQIKKVTGEGDRTSFFKLFAENDFNIVIPMLQREYAQGRENAAEVRNEFLTALFGYLEEGRPERDLDFIYGNVNDREFVPLDGQQRLTTLFLLLWYLSRLTHDESLRKEFDKTLLDETGRHCRFTYKTRSSSSDFCDALMLNDIDFNNLLVDDDKRCGEKDATSVKKTIEDKNWFHLSWKHDPTIASMLNMLDAIHEKFKGYPEFLPLLLDKENPIITFLFMELKKYHLSDELYIKMNSRGKPLTSFENFKARYTEFIGDQLKKSDDRVTRTRTLRDGKTISYPLDKYFAERIDNAWTNMIWAYRNQGEKVESRDFGQECDRRMANLLSALLSLKYLELHPQIKGEAENVLTSLVNPSARDYLSFITLRDGDALSLESSIFLTDSMDILADSGVRPKSLLSEEFKHCLPFEQIINKILFTPRDLNYNDRVLLHAYFSYLLTYGNDAGLNHWMRVVYNLANVENNRIDSVAEVANAIRQIRKLLEVAPSILSYLAEGGKVEAFPSWLIEEERIKASLLLREDGDEWLSPILTAENHGYLTGQIGFILEFAGIWEYYQGNHTVDWSKEQNGEFLQRFMKYSVDARVVFDENYENRINDKNYRFERAVLFKGNYLPANNLHHNLLSTNTTKNNVKRDFTWKKLLRIDKDVNATEKRGFVKAVFDDPAFDSKQPNESLKEVFAGKSTGEEWRDCLIKHPTTIDYCQQGFISFSEAPYYEGIFPMSTSRLSGYHRELFTWSLYCDLQGISVEPFENGRRYVECKGTDEFPYLCFDLFKFKRLKYGLAILAKTDTADWSLECFRLEFIRYNEDTKTEIVPELRELLLSEGFVETEESKGIMIRDIANAEEVKQFLVPFFHRLIELKSK